MIFDKLELDPLYGASANSLAQREMAFGTNYKAPPYRTGFFTLLYQALDDFMLKLLIVCAIIQIVIDMSFADPHELAHFWIEGLGIIVAVAIVSLVTAWSDYSKEDKFLKQQSLAESTKTVSLLLFYLPQAFYFLNFCLIILFFCQNSKFSKNNCR